MSWYAQWTARALQVIAQDALSHVPPSTSPSSADTSDDDSVMYDFSDEEESTQRDDTGDADGHIAHRINPRIFVHNFDAEAPEPYRTRVRGLLANMAATWQVLTDMGFPSSDTFNLRNWPFAILVRLDRITRRMRNLQQLDNPAYREIVHQGDAREGDAQNAESSVRRLSAALRRVEAALEDVARLGRNNNVLQEGSIMDPQSHQEQQQVYHEELQQLGEDDATSQPAVQDALVQYDEAVDSDMGSSDSHESDSSGGSDDSQCNESPSIDRGDDDDEVEHGSGDSNGSNDSIIPPDSSGSSDSIIPHDSSGSNDSDSSHGSSGSNDSNGSQFFRRLTCNGIPTSEQENDEDDPESADENGDDDEDYHPGDEASDASVDSTPSASPSPVPSVPPEEESQAAPTEDDGGLEQGAEESAGQDNEDVAQNSHDAVDHDGGPGGNNSDVSSDPHPSSQFAGIEIDEELEERNRVYGTLYGGEHSLFDADPERAIPAFGEDDLVPLESASTGLFTDGSEDDNPDEREEDETAGQDNDGSAQKSEDAIEDDGSPSGTNAGVSSSPHPSSQGAGIEIDEELEERNRIYGTLYGGGHSLFNADPERGIPAFGEDDLVSLESASRGLFSDGSESDSAMDNGSEESAGWESNSSAQKVNRAIRPDGSPGGGSSDSSSDSSSEQQSSSHNSDGDRGSTEKESSDDDKAPPQLGLPASNETIEDDDHGAELPDGSSVWDAPPQAVDQAFYYPSAQDHIDRANGGSSEADEEITDESDIQAELEAEHNSSEEVNTPSMPEQQISSLLTRPFQRLVRTLRRREVVVSVPEHNSNGIQEQTIQQAHTVGDLELPEGSSLWDGPPVGINQAFRQEIDDFEAQAQAQAQAIVETRSRGTDRATEFERVQATTSIVRSKACAKWAAKMAGSNAPLHIRPRIRQGHVQGALDEAKECDEEQSAGDDAADLIEASSTEPEPTDANGIDTNNSLQFLDEQPEISLPEFDDSAAADESLHDNVEFADSPWQREPEFSTSPPSPRPKIMIDPYASVAVDVGTDAGVAGSHTSSYGSDYDDLGYPTNSDKIHGHDDGDSDADEESGSKESSNINESSGSSERHSARSEDSGSTGDDSAGGGGGLSDAAHSHSEPSSDNHSRKRKRHGRDSTPHEQPPEKRRSTSPSPDSRGSAKNRSHLPTTPQSRPQLPHQRLSQGDPTWPSPTTPLPSNLRTPHANPQLPTPATSSRKSRRRLSYGSRSYRYTGSRGTPTLCRNPARSTAATRIDYSMNGPTPANTPTSAARTRPTGVRPRGVSARKVNEEGSANKLSGSLKAQLERARRNFLAAPHLGTRRVRRITLQPGEGLEISIDKRRRTL